MWLNEILPYTKRIIYNKQEKRITLVHPHFNQGPFNYKRLIKSLSLNTHLSYLVECVGFASIKGMIILNRIVKHLKKLDNVEYVKFNHNIESGMYNLQIKFI